MKIKFTDVKGEITELEVSSDYQSSLVVDVSTEIGMTYLESLEAEKKNDRKNSRRDRHTSLESFTYEDARYFGDGTDLLADLMSSETIDRAMLHLSERQQYLIKKCCLEGWSYTELAALEDKDESAIRHAIDRAKKKLRNLLS
ncbi:MAG: sigma factor-like helix-turn-helix DNA-binding protein [Anaerovoracaceae bacterium]